MDDKINRKYRNYKAKESPKQKPADHNPKQKPADRNPKQKPAERDPKQKPADHKKRVFDKPGNMLYPVPAVLVSCCDEEGRPNLITVAWAGTVCSDPPMLSISVRRSRFSHGLISTIGEFVVNLTTEELATVTDKCGVRSGRDMDKFEEYGLTPIQSRTVKPPGLKESPVNIECRVVHTMELGSHDLFIAEVTAVCADEALFDEKGKFHLEKAGLIAYSHGSYFALGKQLGTFGYSVRKKK